MNNPDVSSLPPFPVLPPPSGPRAPARVSTRGRRLLAGCVAGFVVGAAVMGTALVVTDEDGIRTVDAVAAPRHSPSADDGGIDVRAVLAAAVPAVVGISVSGASGPSAGTGFVIRADGVVVTNNHVVAGATRITVALPDGRTWHARILGRDPSTDLAVLHIDASNLPTVQLGDSERVRVGDDVVAIGNALGPAGSLSVTRGIVSAVHRDVPADTGVQLSEVIQTDAAINPGNSGGPLVDARGQVVGINTTVARTSRAQNVGFAIAISQALPTIDALRRQEPLAFLGVATADAGSAAATQLGVTSTVGAVVTQVSPGTPAAAAGLAVGDVIVRIGNITIEDSADVLPAIRRHRPGDAVTIVTERDGRRVGVEATFGRRSDTGS